VNAAPIAITSVGLHVPGVSFEALLGEYAPAPACAPEQASELLGAKGLLNKEPATRLALCAVHRALDWPARAPRLKGAPDPTVAVVACSNFGNLATVQAIARTLHTGGLADVSALDAPNASSNVMASTVAMWFRFGGPNLMICSGASAGLDGIFLACALLRAGRAQRVVVVGAEPGDDVARRFHAARAGRRPGDELRAGAAAVLLERAQDTHAVRLADQQRHAADAPPRLPAHLPMLIGPVQFAACAERSFDPARVYGDTYGAQGVLQVALAAALMRAAGPARPARIALVCGDAADGWRSVVVQAPADPASAGTTAKGAASCASLATPA
jgi:hypothetical protein